jgi:hypothetical protein
VRQGDPHAYQIGTADLGGAPTIVVRDRSGATTLVTLTGDSPDSVVELIEQWPFWQEKIESRLAG